MCFDNSSTKDLLRLAKSDPRAASDALALYRERLISMVGLHMDRRLAARVDPSDVVQDVLLEAAGKLGEYLRHPTLPLYPWLRHMASQRIIDLHRRHVLARCRSVRQESPPRIPMPDESVTDLAGRLVASGTTPSGRMEKEETQRQVRAALTRLAPEDREVLTLWYLEQLSAQEMAAVLGITEQAVRHRHRRALERLGGQLAARNAQERRDE